MTTFTLSPHALSLYTDCKRCFWLDKNEKIKRPSGPYPSLPSGMDLVLKRHFDAYVNAGKLPPALHELEGQVTLLKDQELLKEWRGKKGLSWTDERGDALQGSIDNILQKDDKLIVLDYKTRGFKLKQDTASYYKNQMDIYNLLLRKNDYATADHSLLLFYYPREVAADGSILFNTDLVRIPVDTDNALALFNAALKTLKGRKPKPSANCKFCEWTENRLK